MPQNHQSTKYYKIKNINQILLVEFCVLVAKKWVFGGDSSLENFSKIGLLIMNGLASNNKCGV
jgi:hypothetical protein